MRKKMGYRLPISLKWQIVTEILGLFLGMIFCGTLVFGEDKADFRYVMPEIWESAKLEFKKMPIAEKKSVIFRVQRAKLVDWEHLSPQDYEQVYEQLIAENFFSQFSLKRGYRLEPFLPLLFPENPDILENWVKEDENKGELTIKEQIQQAKNDVNWTLHEIYQEQFLIPLHNWCMEQNVLIEYIIQAEDFVPIRYLMEDALRLRHPTVLECKTTALNQRALQIKQNVMELAGTIDEKMGEIEGDLKKKSKTDEEVLLLPDDFLCQDFNKYPGKDFICEFQIPYIKMTLKETRQIGNGGEKRILTEVGMGPKCWKKILLAVPLEKFRPETQQFLERFRKYGGEILIK